MRKKILAASLTTSILFDCDCFPCQERRPLYCTPAGLTPPPNDDDRNDPRLPKEGFFLFETTSEGETPSPAPADFRRKSFRCFFLLIWLGESTSMRLLSSRSSELLRLKQFRARGECSREAVVAALVAEVVIL